MKLIIATIMLIVVYSVQKSVYRKNWRRNLSINLKFNKGFMEVGEKGSLILVVINGKMLPLPTLHVKYSLDRSFVFDDMENAVVTDYYHKNEVFSILSNQKITRTLEFTAKKRGMYSVENASILVKDFFMTSTFARTIDSDSTIYVFPEKIGMHKLETVMQGVSGDILANRSLMTDPFTFRGIREYQSFDSLSSINWKQSARNNQLMVNEYDFTMDSEVKILLNLDTETMIKTDRLIEESISICSSLSRMFLQKKIAVSLYTNGVDVLTEKTIDVKRGADLSHQITIDKYLTRIYKSKGKDEFIEYFAKEASVAKHNVTYIIVSPYYKEDLVQITDELKKRDISLSMIVPYYDRIGFNIERNYMHGWEVYLDEA